MHRQTTKQPATDCSDLDVPNPCETSSECVRTMAKKAMACPSMLALLEAWLIRNCGHEDSDKRCGQVLPIMDVDMCMCM